MFSTTWALQYWYLVLIAFLIGLATAWWIWGQIKARAGASARAPEPPVVRPVETPAPVAAVEPEPIVEPEPLPEPVTAPQPLAASGPRIAAAVGEPDDLELIKGVGPKLNALLNRLGVRRFDQIAAWTEADIAEVDGYMENFKGRIGRDNWVDQAGYLARGDTAGFEAKYGILGSEKQ